ncbi:hypothetical protein HPB48_014524 [Haemaphysalis longicornis]|uniref:Zinc finger protein n=1 Tax=Haemaphysalis longicornis TaxID=44386 RepID=A0A9J6GY31_HAELO|nr:hypothetical protein HPB48_014524 [Haemaphysalis longicornis]
MGASYNGSLEEPEEATGLIVTSVGAHSMTISWNNSDSGDGIQPSGYLLAICDPSDLDRCLVNKTVSFAPREYQVRVDDLSANTTYTVVLTAFLADSSAIYYGRSLDVGVTTQTSGQPKILDIPDASKPSITISIKQAPVSSNYTVTMDKVTANSTTKTVEKLDAQVKDAPVTLNITDIDPASHYEVTVKNCSGRCEVEASLHVQAKVGSPTEPQSLNYTKVSLHSVTITWKRPELAEGPLDGYMVTLSNRSSSFQIITKSTKLSVGNLASSCHYKITVAAFNTGAHGTKEGPAVEISVNTLQPGGDITRGLAVLACELCGQCFVAHDYLEKHQRQEHGIRPKGNYQCSYCPFTHDWKASVLKHERSHTGERPHVCEICQVGFLESTHLKDHMRTHTNERPFECDVCHLTFRRRSYMVRHRQLHENARPYECPDCDRSFTQKCHLRKHRLAMHVVVDNRKDS